MGDTVVPVLPKARMAQSTALMLTYDDLLDEGSVPATSAFTVTVRAAARRRSSDPPHREPSPE